MSFMFTLEVQPTKQSGWSKKDDPYLMDSLRTTNGRAVWSTWTPWVDIQNFWGKGFFFNLANILQMGASTA